MIEKSEFLIVFDTSVLLDLYSYSADTFSPIVDYFLDNLGKLYISEQVYFEYLRNRHQVRVLQSNKYNIFKKAASNNIDDAVRLLSNISSNKILLPVETNIKNEVSESTTKLEKLKKTINNEVEKILSEVFEYENDENDIIFDLVNLIYDYCRPHHFTIGDKLKISIEAEQRFLLGIRPGITDQKKPVNKIDKFSKYGDVIVWKDLLLKNQLSKVVFLVNERKTDWWDNYEERIIADELLDEWKEHSNGTLEFYSLGQFLDIQANKLFSTNVIQEVNECNFNNFVDENKEKVFSFISENIDIKSNIDLNKLAEYIQDFTNEATKLKSIDKFEVVNTNYSKEKFQIINISMREKNIYLSVDCNSVIKSTVLFEYFDKNEGAFDFDLNVMININATIKMNVKIESFFLKKLKVSEIEDFIINWHTIEETTKQ